MDPPPGAEHLPSPLPLPEFSASFPLPFRVLFLVGLAILLWALNLHVLGLLGLDVSWVLDIRDSDDADLGDGSRGADGGFNGSFDDNHGDEKPASSPRPLTPNRFVGPTRAPGAHLAGPVYRLFLIYAAWCTGGWIVFRVLTGSDTGAMERLRGVVGLVCLGPVLAALLPLRGAAGLRERQALRRALWRCINPPADAPIYFCDVILADIATSFAKVLGDLYVSAHQVVFGGITHGRVAQLGVGKWITLGMVCLPYIIRFRQCMLEFYHSGWKSMRPFANALKYCSAFPVIFLSAAQKIVVQDVAAAKGISVAELGQSGERWFGEHRLFRLWLLAVVVNSMYSFFWDVQKDWGLSLLQLDTWIPSRNTDSSKEGYLTPTPTSRPSPPVRRGGPLGWLRNLPSRNSGTGSAQRSPVPLTEPPRSTYFGLRPTLLLPDPAVYYLFTIIDFVLRFTWSLELSTHLHTMDDIESGVFFMEALELVRRWMWVFIRVEWEAVRMGEMARFRGPGHAERTAVLWDDKTDQ